MKSERLCSVEVAKNHAMTPKAGGANAPLKLIENKIGRPFLGDQDTYRCAHRDINSHNYYALLEVLILMM